MWFFVNLSWIYSDMSPTTSSKYLVKLQRVLLPLIVFWYTGLTSTYLILMNEMNFRILVVLNSNIWIIQSKRVSPIRWCHNNLNKSFWPKFKSVNALQFSPLPGVALYFRKRCQIKSRKYCSVPIHAFNFLINLVCRSSKITRKKPLQVGLIN